MKRRADPASITQFFLDHPWWAALISGLAAALLIVGIVGVPVWIAIGVGVVFTVLTGLVWRPRGPGYRWRQAVLRRYPRKF